MSLLFFDGFTDCATYLKPEVSGARVSISGRDGSTDGAYISNSDGSPYTLTLPTPAATCIGAVAVYRNSTVNTSAYIMCFVDSAGTDQLTLGLNGSGVLEVRKGVGGTLLGSGPTHAPNVWHQYCMKAILTTATTSTVYVYMDGSSTPIMTITGVATSTLTSSVYYVKLMSKAPGDTYRFYFDDFYVCDAVDATSTQGRANNDYLGDLKIAALIPSGNGDTTAWTPSSGTNHALLVDEQPPNTSDYVTSSAIGQQDLFALGDLPGTAATVYGVRQGIYAQKTDAGSASVKPTIKENSTTTVAAAQALSTSWGSFHGPIYICRPSASTTPMTVSDVNAMQAGMEAA